MAAMNILITGANGYIGRALVQRLLSVGASTTTRRAPIVWAFVTTAT
jgi:nucleoside-diphosphate-sugar epimerase